MKRRTKNLVFIGIVVCTLLALYISMFVFDLSPRLGLDLSGGISLVYEAQGKTIDPGVLDKTVEKIRERVDRLGVAEPEITRQGERNVIVQIPGIQDTERAKAIVGKTAQLQFRIVAESKPQSEVKDDPNWAVTEGEENLKPDKEIILSYETETEGKKEKLLYKLGPTLMSGDLLKEASVGYADDSTPKVNFKLTGEGKTKFGEITTANAQKQLAIVLDYKVESAPNINEPITEGTGEITGNFTEKEAKDLSIVLNTGALPVSLKLITEQSVTATLGRDSLRQGLVAGVVGLLIVALYMVLYYRALGFITCFGLLVFGGLMYGFISVLGEFWSLTLAGIAGVIVSIGIAADSSVVYFERIKEEIRAGRTLRSSADRAYKNAFRTIIAADTVTFSAAAILYIFAVGSVRGFAFTLGMATIFDVFISYLFIHPLTSLLSELEWFGKPWIVGVRHIAGSRSGGDAK
ncbi:MAG: protein translocase subunit SecD [Actinobacteria bacterium]|nr:protein translocase subunit SecD [Actinomycetota bacterium]